MSARTRNLLRWLNTIYTLQMLPANCNMQYIQKPDNRPTIQHQEQYHMQNESTWYNAQSVACNTLERQRTPCTSEWMDTALTSGPGRWRSQSQPTFANQITSQKTWRWKGLRRFTWTVQSGEEKERATGYSPWELWLQMEWTWMSDAEAQCLVMEHSIRNGVRHHSVQMSKTVVCDTRSLN